MPYQVDRIDPKVTALVVVDMQNDFVAAGAPMEKAAARAIVPTLMRTLQFCRHS
jgi:biuret amidohydrolase